MKGSHQEILGQLTDNKQKLIDAAYNGDIEGVKDLVENEKIDVDIEESRSQRRTPLIMATIQGHLDIVKYFIEKKANLDKGDCYQRTPLMFAVGVNGDDPTASNRFAIAQLLIANNAEVNITDSQGVTALMTAVGRYNIPAVELLLQTNANINAIDKYGETALIYLFHASNQQGYEKSPELLKLLLTYKPNLNVKSQFGNTPLKLALFFGELNKELVEILINAGADRNELFKNGETELMYSIRVNDFEASSKLIKDIKNINAQDNNGMTPLMIAVDEERENVVDLLVNLGADLNLKDKDGRTALLYANSNKIFEKLIHYGANINIISMQGRTVLTTAMKITFYKDFKNILKFLLKEKGINKEVINALSSDGETILFTVAQKTVDYISRSYPLTEFSIYKEIIELLLEAGADPTIICKRSEYYPGTTVFSFNQSEIKELFNKQKIDEISEKEIFEMKP